MWIRLKVCVSHLWIWWTKVTSEAAICTLCRDINSKEWEDFMVPESMNEKIPSHDISSDNFWNYRDIRCTSYVPIVCNIWRYKLVPSAVIQQCWIGSVVLKLLPPWWDAETLQVRVWTTRWKIRSVQKLISRTLLNLVKMLTFII